MIDTRDIASNSRLLQLCWALAALWIPVNLFSVAQAHGSTAAATYGAIQGLLLLVIAIIHGTLSYGGKGFGVYVVIVSVVIFLLEASSIATGFPFGFYTHASSPVPAPLGVPITVMVGCCVLGWFSWTLARLLARQNPWKSAGFELFSTPLIAAFIYAGFDYPLDPIGSTVNGMWEYKHPSGQFGVPLTNYLGWIFTGWVAFQLFALFENRFTPNAAVTQRNYWLLPAIVWLVIAAQFPIQFAGAPAGLVEIESARFVVADIFEAAVAGSLFTLVFVSLLALNRLAAWRNNAG